MRQRQKSSSGHARVVSGLFAVLLLCSGAATAQRHRIGNDSVEIPPPTGFVTVSSHSAALSDRIRATFPSGMRVIDVFATQAELDVIGSPPSLDRFFSVMIARDFEHFRATEKQFDGLLPNFERQLRDGTDNDPIYRREPWALFHSSAALLTDFGRTRQRYCASAIALIGKIPLYLISCTLDNGEPDRQWLRTAMNGWVDTLHRLNQPKAASRLPATATPADP